MQGETVYPQASLMYYNAYEKGLPNRTALYSATPISIRYGESLYASASGNRFQPTQPTAQSLLARLHQHQTKMKPSQARMKLSFLATSFFSTKTLAHPKVDVNNVA
jgi:hypothetical protein